MTYLPREEDEYIVFNEFKDDVLRVVVTEGTTEIALALLYRIFSNEIFGPHQSIFISICEAKAKASFLESVGIELAEFSPNMLIGMRVTHQLSEAFKDADVAFCIGQARGYEFTKDEYSDPYFKECVLVAKAYGEAIERYAKKDVKVIVLGCTPASIISRYLHSVPLENITALSLFNVKMTAAHISAHLNCRPDHIKNIIIWGANNNQTFPDCRYIRIEEGKVMHEKFDVWLRTNLPSIIQTTKQRTLYRRSLAYALADHCKLLWHGTPKNEWTCMCVLSDGSYDVQKGIFFSYPVTCEDQRYKIVQDLADDDYVKRHIQQLSKILLQEVKAAFKVCGLKW